MACPAPGHPVRNRCRRMVLPDADVVVPPGRGLEVFVMEGSFNNGTHKFGRWDWLRLPPGRSTFSQCWTFGCEGLGQIQSFGGDDLIYIQDPIDTFSRRDPERWRERHRTVNVRLWLKADVAAREFDVRFTPESRHSDRWRLRRIEEIEGWLYGVSMMAIFPCNLATGAV